MPKSSVSTQHLNPNVIAVVADHNEVFRSSDVTGAV